MTGKPTVSIVVPSYKRPESLARCLNALASQSFPDFEVLCVFREDDTPSQVVVEKLGAQDERFRAVTVGSPGFAAALNAGLAAARGTIVSFTDDDAEAPRHWLETIVKHLRNHPECGCVGGRDVLQLEHPRLADPGISRRIGSYTWTGKFVGNHHCPIKEEFVVADILKGVNMSYRRELIADTVIGDGLRGANGVQMGTEQALAARVRGSGKQLHFVRDAWVLHHVEPRKADDNRTDMLSPYALETTYNYTYTLWRYQSLKTAFCSQIREWIVGSKKVPGLVRLLRYPAKAPVSLRHWRTMLPGIVDGYGDRQKRGAASLRV